MIGQEASQHLTTLHVNPSLRFSFEKKANQSLPFLKDSLYQHPFNVKYSF